MTHGERIDVICAGCGVTFSYLRKGGPLRKWCSERCRKLSYIGDARCQECGGPVSYSTKDYRKGARRCASCWNTAGHAEQHEEARERTERMLSMRRAGFSNVEIAEAERTTGASVNTQLSRKRVARFPELEYVRSPYMENRRETLRG